jgi:enoyl-CoA hydratase
MSQGDYMSVFLKPINSEVTILQVDRPHVRNALDWEAMQAFRDCIEQAHESSQLRALIITGAGDVFISGGDLKALSGYPSQVDGLRLSQTMSAALNRLEALPCPTIAAINGPARGGGAEISLACDFRVIGSNADIGLVQIGLGLSPGWGAGQRLLRLVGYSRAMEWLVTGRILSAEEAFAHGLANRLSDPGETLSTAIRMANQIASQPAKTVQTIKQLLRSGLFLPPETAAAHEQAVFPSLWADESHLRAVEEFLKRK